MYWCRNEDGLCYREKMNFGYDSHLSGDGGKLCMMLSVLLQVCARNSGGIGGGVEKTLAGAGVGVFECECECVCLCVSETL